MRMRVLLVGDRVQLSAKGQGTFAEWHPMTGGVVTETKPNGRSIRVQVDGSRTAVWFPVNFWNPEWVDRAVRQEERAADGGGAGNPEAPLRELQPARGPGATTMLCLACGRQQPLGERDDRTPGPFTMPRCCGDWMHPMGTSQARARPISRV